MFAPLLVKTFKIVRSLYGPGCLTLSAPGAIAILNPGMPDSLAFSFALLLALFLLLCVSRHCVTSVHSFYDIILFF